MAAQEKLMTHFQNVQLIAYPAVGHAIHWEMPTTVAGDISVFVKMIKSS